MLSANGPIWIVLFLQHVLWTGFAWLTWQVLRKCIRFTATQIYYVNTALQLLAAGALVIGASYFVRNDTAIVNNAIGVFNLNQFIRSNPFLAEALLLLYILALGIQLMQWILGLTAVRKLMRSGLPADGVLLHQLQQQQSLLQLNRKIELRVSDVVESPLTIGWIKPMIILPVAAINQLKPNELEALLLHELVHIRRYDYLVNHALVLSRALLCFNPFIWLLHEETILYREISCDDAVRSRQETSVYAGALFRMAQLQQQHRLAMAATGSKDGLRKRIAYMLEPMQVMQTSASRIIIVVFGLGALALLLFFSAKTAQEKRLSKRKPKTSNTKLYALPKPVLAKNNRIQTLKPQPKKRSLKKEVLIEETIVTNTNQALKTLKTWSDLEQPVVEERILIEGNPLLKQVASPTEKQVLRQVMKEKIVAAADLLKQLKQDKQLSEQEKLWLIANILKRTGIQFDSNNQVILPEGFDIQSMENILRNRNLLLRERIIPDSLIHIRIQ